MTVPATMSVKILQVTLDGAEQLGVEKARTKHKAGLESYDLSDPDGRVPLECVVRLCAVLREALGPSAAIRLGEVMAKEHATVLAYLVENCDNLEHAYRTIHRYRSIVMELTPPELEVMGNEASLGCIYPPWFVDHAPETVELLLTFWLTKGRRLTGVDWTPKAITLQNEQSDPNQYRRVFRCPVTNSAARTQIIFDASLLQAPVLGADSNLRYYLTPIADQILTQLPQRDGFLQEVQVCIASVLKEGDSHLKTVAANLKVSSRTLQRRLKRENTSFGVLLDEARHVAALEYLNDQRISIADTAFLLGFSEPSTFYRAFKRWTGTTPASYRQSILESA